MNDINNLLNALDGLIGQQAAAPLRWKYEQARAVGKILLPPPHALSTYGEYELGNVIWNGSSTGTFGLWENELCQHIGIFGRTGGGKTNLALLLLQQLMKNNRPFLILDWKRSYRQLTKTYPVWLFTPGNSQEPFYLNPFDLRNIPTETRASYLRHVLSLLLDSYFPDLKLLSKEGVEYLFMRGIDALSKDREVFTFKDLYSWLLCYQTKSREYEWRVTAFNVLYKLTTGPIVEVLNNPKSINLKWLINQNAIIELQWLGSPKDKSFLTQTLALQLYYHFSLQPLSDRLRYSVFIEEAHNVLLRHLDGYETVLEMALRQIREYGVGICLLDQHPSLMSLPALGTFATVAFNLRASEDLKVIASSLGLGDDGNDLNLLRTGQAICKVQNRFLKPILVDFSKANIPDTIDWDRLIDITDEKSVRDIWNLPATPGISGEITNIENGSIKSAEKPVCDLPISAGISSEIDGFNSYLQSDKLKKMTREKLLIDIYAQPLTQTVQRYKNFGLNPRIGNQLKIGLENEGLITGVSISNGKARVKLYEVTNSGKECLRRLGVKVESRWRHGSIVHQYWCQWIMQKYEIAGYEVKTEYPIGKGKAIDLVAKNSKERIAIEVETGKSDVVANIEKCLKAGFKKVIVVALAKSVRNLIERSVFGSDDKVEVVTVKEI